MGFSRLIRQRHLPEETAVPPSRPPRPISEEQLAAIANAHELSPRETEVLWGILNDRHEHEIAAELGISPHTVHTEIVRLRAKFGAKDRLELVLKVLAELPILSKDRPTPPKNVT
jgi:DNA-binding CsgD family transcriptional regulator